MELHRELGSAIRVDALIAERDQLIRSVQALAWHIKRA